MKVRGRGNQIPRHCSVDRTLVVFDTGDEVTCAGRRRRHPLPACGLRASRIKETGAWHGTDRHEQRAELIQGGDRIARNGTFIKPSHLGLSLYQTAVEKCPHRPAFFMFTGLFRLKQEPETAFGVSLTQYSPLCVDYSRSSVVYSNHRVNKMDDEFLSRVIEGHRGDTTRRQILDAPCSGGAWRVGPRFGRPISTMSLEKLPSPKHIKVFWRGRTCHPQAVGREHFMRSRACSHCQLTRA